MSSRKELTLIVASTDAKIITEAAQAALPETWKQYLRDLGDQLLRESVYASWTSTSPTGTRQLHNKPPS
jgi:hypothetical protein